VARGGFKQPFSVGKWNGGQRYQRPVEAMVEVQRGTRATADPKRPPTPPASAVPALPSTIGALPTTDAYDRFRKRTRSSWRRPPTSLQLTTTRRSRDDRLRRGHPAPVATPWSAVVRDRTERANPRPGQKAAPITSFRRPRLWYGRPLHGTGAPGPTCAHFLLEVHAPAVPRSNGWTVFYENRAVPTVAPRVRPPAPPVPPCRPRERPALRTGQLRSLAAPTAARNQNPKSHLLRTLSSFPYFFSPLSNLYPSINFWHTCPRP